MLHVRRWVAGLATAALTLPLLVSCSSGSGPSLVVYNAQHEELIDEVGKAFTKKTGIEVELRNGSDLELANQLLEEGDASPADVFLTENSPAMTLVDGKSLLAKLPSTTLDRIPDQYRPDDGEWTGFATKETAMTVDQGVPAALGPSPAGAPQRQHPGRLVRVGFDLLASVPDIRQTGSIAVK